MDSLGNGAGRVEGDRVFEILGEAFPQFLHGLPDALRAIEGVGTGKLVDGNIGSRLAVEPPDDVVDLRAEFDPGHVAEPDDGAAGILADDDIPKLLG